MKGCMIKCNMFVSKKRQQISWFGYIQQHPLVNFKKKHNLMHNLILISKYPFQNKDFKDVYDIEYDFT